MLAGARRLGRRRGARRRRRERRRRRASCARATCPATRCPRSSARPRPSRTRRSRRASACPRSRRSRAARRSSPPPGSALAEVVGDAALLVAARRRRRARRAHSTACLDDTGARDAAARRRPRPGRAVHLGRHPSTGTSPRTAASPQGSPRMKALVTGARGFVGPHLVAHSSVRATTSSPLDRHGPDPSTSPTRDAVHDALARDAQPEVVYHLAALEPRRRDLEEPGRVVPGQRRRHAQRARRLQPSCGVAPCDRGRLSSEEYGRVDRSRAPAHRGVAAPAGHARTARARWPPTSSRCRPSSATGSATIRVRPFSHTGPGQSPRSSSPRSRHGSRGPSATAIDEIPVGSLDAGARPHRRPRRRARATALLAEHGEPGEVYNVCSGHRA